MDSAHTCEEYLCREKQDRIDKGILISEIGIIDRLLCRGRDLDSLYNEISKNYRPDQWKRFLDVAVNVAAFWNPEEARAFREKRKRLEEVNSSISVLASQLSELLDERCRLHDESGFYADTHYDIIDVIDKAAKDNYLYCSYVQDDLRRLSYQFDLKYWPCLAGVVGELAQDAEQADVVAGDSWTDAATMSSRTSKYDFLRTLFVAIEESSSRYHGGLPATFKIKDDSWATLVNCLLDLDVEVLVDAQYIKRFRQRFRDTYRASSIQSRYR